MKTWVAYGNSHLACEQIYTRHINSSKSTYILIEEGAPLVEFMYLL